MNWHKYQRMSTSQHNHIFLTFIFIIVGILKDVALDILETGRKLHMLMGAIADNVGGTRTEVQNSQN